MQRMVILTNMIAPYRIPLFNFIAQEHPDFHVIFLVERERSRSWNVAMDEIRFSYEVLPITTGFNRYIQSLLHFNPYIIAALRRARPEILIIGGWAYIEMWLALVYARLLGLRMVLWSGGDLNSVKRKSRLMNFLRQCFVRSMNAIVTYGTSGSNMFLNYGVSAERIAIGFNTGDVDFYFQRVTEYRQTSAYRKDYEQWPRPLFLYVGQLVAFKGVKLLLSAMKTLEDRPGLLIVGSGNQKDELEHYCHENNLTTVSFIDFQQRENLARYFAVADAFVLPSLHEQGAIVISEALASGLYTLASEFDGIARDLIDLDTTGTIISPNNIELLTEQIARVISQWRVQPWDSSILAAHFMQKQPVKRYASAILAAAAIAEQE